MQGSSNTPLIQRYSIALWPHIRGEVPFVVRGPNWNGRHVMRRVLQTHDFDGLGPDDIRLVVGEFMLREGFCEAAWSIELETCQPAEHRWSVAIRQVADEIPKVSDEWPISLGAWELLDGMSKVEHYRHLLWQDAVILEPMAVPVQITSDSLAA
jgi:hypothetical protein